MVVLAYGHKVARLLFLGPPAPVPPQGDPPDEGDDDEAHDDQSPVPQSDGFVILVVVRGWVQGVVGRWGLGSVDGGGWGFGRGGAVVGEEGEVGRLVGGYRS